MIKLSKDKVLLLQQLLIQETGGSAGIRDMNMLESALENVYQTFDNNELYPTKEEKAARLGYALINNHAFVDGNKRIGIYIMITFLEVNGIPIECENSELIELGLGIANGKIKYESVLEWINNHKNI